MPIDRSAFIGNYVDETRDNIRRINDGVVKLKSDPENEEELNATLRALHTIKGSSRMLKFRAVEQVAHGAENLFKGLREKRYELNNSLIQLVFIGSDLLKLGVERILSTGNDEIEVDRFLETCERAYANEPYLEDIDLLQKQRAAAAAAATETSAPPVTDARPAEAGGRDGDSARGSAADADRPANNGKPTPGDAGKRARDASRLGEGTPDHESIRVKQSNVNEIIETLNTVIIKQFQFKQIQEELASIERGYSDWLVAARRKQTGARGGSRNRSRGNQNPENKNGHSREETAALTVTDLAESQLLFKSIQNLRKAFVDQIAVLEQNSYKLQEQVMRLSMLPLDLILGELPRMVTETAVTIGKDIAFSVHGSDILMDKAILEKLNDPIIHLVRNAVDHGIESPSDRDALGKPPAGTINITCASESGNIIIRITDDGKGIDYEQVKRRAIERGLVNAADAEELTEQDVLGFIFMPGFSTKETVTDLSGRGVGLDIVRYNIDKVKGKVTVRSKQGEGTEFILSVPLSLATVAGFFVRAGGQKFLIPSNFVQKIVRLGKNERVTYYNKEGFKLDNQIVPLYSLSALIGRPPENRGTHLYVVVVESMGDRIGVVVDGVLQHAGLIYKPVPHNMQKIKIIQGIVFDESYHIINILFVPELISRFKRIKSIDLIGGVAGEQPQAKKVLVVDDSLNTREIEKSILELEGYEVITATDGIDGLECVRSHRFDMIISDIDMPRMDGITMIENLRKDAAYAQTPIVVVTSHTDVSTIQRAKQAGANAHINKSDFDRTGLVEIADKLMAAAGNHA